MTELLFEAAKLIPLEGQHWLAVRPKPESLPQVRRWLYGMGDKKTYALTIKEHRKKRSLDANAYCWVLIDKISTAVGVPKEEVYRQAIGSIGGVSEVLTLRSDAVARWVQVWGGRGLGWFCERLGPAQEAGYETLAAYYGSSAYDTTQMSHLIDSLVQECQALGIETASERELSLLKEGWGA